MDRKPNNMLRALEELHPRNLKHTAVHLQRLVTGHLWAQILAGMVLGVGVGVLLGPSVGWVEPGTAAVVGDWLALPGMLFLSLIQMIVMPLVVTAIIRGIAASNDAEQLKKNGIWLGVYFVVTTVIATAIGIGLALALKPGSYIDPRSMQAAQKVSELGVAETAGKGGAGPTGLPEHVISIFPSNPLQSMVEGQMLQVVLFAVLIGIALLALKPTSAKPILELLGSIQELTMKIVGWAMRLAPLAVFGLLARQMVTTGIEALVGLAAYVGTLLLGMVVLMLVYLLIVRVLGDGRPWRFMRGARDAQLLAFSTDSSAATMPVTIRVAEEELGVRPSVSQFVIPVGASMNMGGSALYQGLATVFMAQIYGMHLPLAALLALVATSVGASIGTPATPGVGIVVLATVLTSAGVPVAGLGLILGVDQILERFRTVLNVSGDLAACTVMDRRIGGAKSREDELREDDAREEIRRSQHEDVVVG
jgi:Na+/H+-dicarboxylate symporter